jgi:hypothetical protein
MSSLVTAVYRLHYKIVEDRLLQSDGGGKNMLRGIKELIVASLFVDY